MKLTTTREAAHINGLKVLVYGAAGVGKTTLASTCRCWRSPAWRTFTTPIGS